MENTAAFSEEMTAVIKAYIQVSPGGDLVPGLNSAIKAMRGGEDFGAWKILFDRYNKTQIEAGRSTLSMGCAPCFPKVFMHIRSLLKSFNYVFPK